MEYEIHVESIEGIGEEVPRTLIFVGDVAYEVLHPRARGGQFVVFVDKDGKKSKPVYVRRYGE